LNASSSTLTIKTPRVFSPLLAPSRYKGAYGGRGSGKSHFFAELAVETAFCRPGFRMVCVREVQRSLKDSAKRLIEDKIIGLGLGKSFSVLHDRIDTPGGGVIIFQGMQDHTAETIKSLEGFDVAWMEEAQTISARSLELLRPTIRNAESEIWASWNPRHPDDPIEGLLRSVDPRENAAVVQANYTDNPYFPDVLKAERMDDFRHKPDRYAHIWMGEFEPMALGAIWNRQTIHAGRRSEAPKLDRILVSVDPAITNHQGSDEHGIVCGGVGGDQRGYILDDASTHGGPHEWATRAVATYDRFDADAIVVEVNQGGDMVAQTIRTVRPNIRIIEVRATRGKHVRAEPIAALYALGRVSHIGTFPELEAQMCQMTAAGFEGKGSPDRVDALVWLLTELFPKMTRKAPPQGPIVANSDFRVL